MGLGLALYALFVEYSITNPDFTALCDLTIFEMEASCSKTLSSPESHLVSFFGMVSKEAPIYLNPPNALLGVFFYALMLLLPPSPIQRLLSTLSLLTTMFLLRILVMKSEICLLCYSTHVINASLFFLTVVKTGVKTGVKAKGGVGGEGGREGKFKGQ
jgi:uncharacterized membrane protein